MTEVLIRGGQDAEKHKERPCGDRGRDWSDVSTSQETAGFPATPAAKAGNHRADLAEPLEKAWPAGILTFDFCLQNCERVNVCCSKHMVCVHLLSQSLIQLSVLFYVNYKLNSI